MNRFFPCLRSLLLVSVGLSPSFLLAEVRDSDTYSFTVVQKVRLECPPEVAWNAFTGDVSGWWDHSFSGSPARFILEARPGGSFIELFDDQENGVEHARVTFVQAPERLHFSGPLPFNGLAMTMHHIVSFQPLTGDDGEVAATEVIVTVNAFGKLEAGWDAAVDGVWHHFLVERLKPFIEHPEILSPVGEAGTND